MNVGASDIQVSPDESHKAVRERMQFPAMFLVANGAMNLMCALAAVGLVMVTAATPADEVQRQWVARLEQGARAEGPLSEVVLSSLAQVREADPHRFKLQRVLGDGLLAAMLLVVAILGVLGGVSMYRARSYPLAMVGTLASLAPCVSPMAWCCAGELVGVWCVVVLLLPGVRAGFR